VKGLKKHSKVKLHIMRLYKGAKRAKIVFLHSTMRMKLCLRVR
jgi:hypothetical protein